VGKVTKIQREKQTVWATSVFHRLRAYTAHTRASSDIPWTNRRKRTFCPSKSWPHS